MYDLRKRNCSEYLSLLVDRHGMRVGLAAKFIGHELGLNRWQCRDLLEAGTYHDVGKYNIPTEILYKIGRLDKDELNIIKLHPILSAEMYSGISDNTDITEAILMHHENFDGTGYPLIKKGYDIPLGARILRVVDEFDALIEPRPYRDSLSIEKTMSIMENDYRCFDPEVFRVFKDKSGELYNILYKEMKEDNALHKRVWLFKSIYEKIPNT